MPRMKSLECQICHRWYAMGTEGSTDVLCRHCAADPHIICSLCEQYPAVQQIPGNTLCSGCLAYQSFMARWWHDCRPGEQILARM